MPLKNNRAIQCTEEMKNVAVFVCEYLSAVDSDHGVAAVHGQLGYFFQHLLHLWNNELPGENGLQEHSFLNDI